MLRAMFIFLLDTFLSLWELHPFLGHLLLLEQQIHDGYIVVICLFGILVEICNNPVILSSFKKHYIYLFEAKSTLAKMAALCF